MLNQDINELQQSQSFVAHGTPALSGCWKLPSGCAISLQPRVGAVLRIAQGRVWLTVDGARVGHGNESGDLFLQAGQELAVKAGQRLVLESWSEAAEAPVYFEWAPVANAKGVSRWQIAVAQPLRDLGGAVLIAGRAVGRLLKGLAGYGEFLVFCLKHRA